MTRWCVVGSNLQASPFSQGLWSRPLTPGRSPVYVFSHCLPSCLCCFCWCNVPTEFFVSPVSKWYVFFFFLLFFFFFFSYFLLCFFPMLLCLFPSDGKNEASWTDEDVNEIVPKNDSMIICLHGNICWWKLKEHTQTRRRQETERGALLWLVTVRYLTLKLVSVQKNNLFLCAPLADHFASLGKNSLTWHRGSRCT